MKIYSIEDLRAAAANRNVEQEIEFFDHGRRYTVTKRIVNGEMEVRELTRPVGEMITSDALRKELLEKIVLDVELGRESVPLLYRPIYQTLSDPSFPEVLDAKWAQYGTVVFAEHIEGQEVKFGSVAAEKGPVARILTYAAGFEYTKQARDFGADFTLTMFSDAFGEAFNALLNHLHLGPILSFNYKADNITSAQGAADDPTWLRYYKTMNQALIDAAVAKRPGTVLLASSADRPYIEQALRGGQVAGTIYPPIAAPQAIIYYDGWETLVRDKTYTYPGVQAGEAYLIRPRRGFKELIKRDLTIESQPGDLSRLVEEQIVAYAYRGVFAAVEENVQKILWK